jgi:hypothetical protein
MKSQVAALRKNLKVYHHYATQSGFGVDARGVVTGPPVHLMVIMRVTPDRPNSQMFHCSSVNVGRKEN